MHGVVVYIVLLKLAFDLDNLAKVVSASQLGTVVSEIGWDEERKTMVGGKYIQKNNIEAMAGSTSNLSIASRVWEEASHSPEDNKHKQSKLQVQDKTSYASLPPCSRSELTSSLSCTLQRLTLVFSRTLTNRPPVFPRPATTQRGGSPKHADRDDHRTTTGAVLEAQRDRPRGLCCSSPHLLRRKSNWKNHLACLCIPGAKEGC